MVNPENYFYPKDNISAYLGYFDEGALTDDSKGNEEPLTHKSKEKESKSEGAINLNRILFLASAPSDQAQLRLDEEHRQIQQALEHTPYEFKSRWAVRPKDVLQAILSLKPEIVHFSGHGLQTGAICFMDESGKTKPVEPLALSALFKLVANHVKCVIMNACYSEAQAAAIAVHIPFVIGMGQSVSDRAAIEFAASFYGVLQEVKVIEKAFEFGRVALQMEGFYTEESNPVLILGEARYLFQSEVEKLGPYLQKKEHFRTEIFRQALNQKGANMGIPTKDIDAIIENIFEKNYEFERRKKVYQDSYTEALKNEIPPLEKETVSALQYLSQSLELDPNTVAKLEKSVRDKTSTTHMSYFDRGWAQMKAGEYELAIKFFSEAIKLQRNYSGAYFERAACFDKLNKKDAAVQNYSQAIKLNRNWEGISLSSAYFDRGLSYYYFGDQKNLNKHMQAAMEDWTKTLELKPDYSLAYYNRALAHKELGNFDTAIKDLTKVIEIGDEPDPVKLATVYYRRALLYEMLGEHQFASQDIQKAVELMGDSPEYQDVLDKYGSDFRNFSQDEKSSLNGEENLDVESSDIENEEEIELSDISEEMT